MVSLREQYERRKASIAAKATPAFALKDYVTIGISVLALITTLFFNVFLKTDDIRGSFRGAPPQFTISGETLFVQVNGGLVVTNTGNRAATVIGAYIMLTQLDDENVPHDPCYRGTFLFTYFEVMPVVFKAGDAAVIPLTFESGTKPLFPKIETDGIQVLACMAVQVLTPSAIFNSSPIPLVTMEVKEGGEPYTKYKRLVDDTTPFTIYRNWSLFW